MLDAARDQGTAGTGTPAAPLRNPLRNVEDTIAFIVFWVLAFVVFLQFFTRYVLNDSLAWTEEGARYLLIAVTFLGGGMAVRRRAHIAVEFFHTMLPARASALLYSVCDLVSVAFYAYAAWLAWRMIGLMQTQRMAVIDLPMSVLYAVVLAGLVMMTVRAVQSAWRRVRHPSHGPSHGDDRP
ncbi:MAG TPA: TRAP transporter small permease [Arenibaculum sp.]|nr:TRAP transporter small permease [Arenibaculum sp.]